MGVDSGFLFVFQLVFSDISIFTIKQAGWLGDPEKNILDGEEITSFKGS